MFLSLCAKGECFGLEFSHWMTSSCLCKWCSEPRHQCLTNSLSHEKHMSNYSGKNVHVKADLKALWTVWAFYIGQLCSVNLAMILIFVRISSIFSQDLGGIWKCLSWLETDGLYCLFLNQSENPPVTAQLWFQGVAHFLKQNTFFLECFCLFGLVWFVVFVFCFVAACDDGLFW